MIGRGVRAGIAGFVLLTAGLLAPLAWAATFAITTTFPTGGTSWPAYSNGFLVQASDSNVYLFDGATNTLAHTIPTTGALSPQHTAVIGSTVYIANQGSSSVTVVNTATHTASVLSTPTCSNPEQLLVVSTRIYVTCTGNARVIVLDSTNNTVSTTLTVGSLPRRPSFAGGYVYVPNENANTVSVITDGPTPSVTATTPVGAMPVGTTAYGSKAYVFNFSAASVSVLQGTSVVSTIAVGNSPQDGTPCGNYVVVANRVSGSASFIDPTSDSVAMTVSGVGGSVTHVVRANSGFAYFGDYSANTITAVDCGTGALAGSITVSGPWGMAFDGPGTGYFPPYVASPIAVAHLPSSSAGSVGAPPPPWLRQTAREPDSACESGWNPSWAHWPHGYTGGWVCTQTLVWSPSLSRYVLE